ncbi:hypothetical protein WJX73_010514 [Symbiochloris irregularis]|uniref:Uncharacterized protein n=1 Tax=Symbiochloris irregularis TaxID=706552 RepID=A0AAW1PCN7_9CHLO
MNITPLQPSTLQTACSWLTVYRQLFAWIVAGNLAIIIAAAAQAFPWAHVHRVQFTAANILVSILARNEVFLRVLYTLLVKAVTVGSPQGLGSLWAPIPLRNLITNFLLHIGGVHSGCGVAGLLWLIYGACHPPPAVPIPQRLRAPPQVHWLGISGDHGSLHRVPVRRGPIPVAPLR